MKLTDAQIKHAKSKPKQYKLSDGRGMYLLVKPTGSKLWRFDYRFKGSQKSISLERTHHTRVETTIGQS